MKRHISLLFVLLSALVVTVCNGANDIPLPPTAFEAAMTEAGTRDAGPVRRRVWSGVKGNHDFSCGRPSLDGKLFSLVDWGTGDVAVYELESGEVRRVTNKGTWNENGSWSECSIFSADGESVLFNYGNFERSADGNGHTYELRMIGLDASTESQKVLMQAPPNQGWLAPADWRDDEFLAISYEGGDEPNRLVAMSPSGGDPRVIAETHGKLPFPARYAPDGQTIAYQRAEEIRLVGRDGTNDRDSGLGEARMIDWSGSATLLFHVPSAGEIRAATLEGGSFGEPDLIDSNLVSAVPLGVGGGKIFYGVAVEAQRVHTATIDWENGRMSEPVPIVATIDGKSEYPTWSPDGRTLAYFHSPLSFRSATSIVLRSANGGEVQHLTDVSMNKFANLVWDPSGTALWLRANGDVQPALYRVDVESGEVSKVFEGMGNDFAVGPDGVIYLHRRPSEGAKSGLHAFNPDTGEMRLIVEDPRQTGVRNLRVSPDGRSIAYSHFDSESKIHSLRVTAIKGGSTREVVRVPVPGYITNIAHTMVWSPDGRKLVYHHFEERPSLVMVDVETGEATTVAEGSRMVHVQLHPDGKQIAFRMGDFITELWTMELPK